MMAMFVNPVDELPDESHLLSMILLVALVRCFLLLHGL